MPSDESKLRLRAIITVEWPIFELRNYKALTIQEAAENQQRWFEEGCCSVEELVSWSTATDVRIEAVENEDES